MRFITVYPSAWFGRSPRAKQHAISAEGMQFDQYGKLNKKIENLGMPWEDQYGYAQAVKVGDTIYLSGQLSHDDQGKFFNPLGPLPTTTLAGCAKAFQGYVVLLCEGAHEVNGSAHTHSVTQGTIALYPFGAGYGDFCGGAGASGGTNEGFVDAVAKAYKVV